ncbi:MAG: hypothetical protein H0T42_24435 [Deltaproteobacteria bacterium]|nr:hypothetical protein [Deltaproteobacteria bacterium]
MSSTDKKLAKDIATNLDRRRTRRRLIALVALAAAIALAVMYLRCGRSLGIGGQDASKGLGSAIVKEITPKRCAIRVSATGITVDGQKATRKAAVTACKETTGADVVVTGDARQGDWDELRTALEAANVPIYKLGRP